MAQTRGDSKSLHDGFAPLSGMDNGERIRWCFIKAALSSSGVIQRQPPAPAALRARDSARRTPAVVIAARRGHSAAPDGVQMGPKTVPWTTPRRVNESTALVLGRRNTLPRLRIGLDVERAGLGAQKRFKLLFFSAQPRALSDHVCFRGAPFRPTGSRSPEA